MKAGWQKGKKRGPMSKETKQKISAALHGKQPKNIVAGWNKGGTSWSKGKKLSEEHKKKIGQANKLFYSNIEVRKEISKRMSKRNKEVFSDSLIGLNKILRHRLEYRQWRTAVYERDNYTCQECNIKGGELNADHIISFSVLLYRYLIKTVEDALECKELWNIDNGRTLCLECHKLTDTYGGRSIKLNKIEKEYVK